MQTINIKPDVQIFNNFIKYFQINKQLDQAEKTYSQLLNEGLKPNIFTFNDIFYLIKDDFIKF